MTCHQDFVHRAVAYSTTDQLVEQVLPFLTRALDEDQQVIVNVASENVRALKQAIGDVGSRISWTDTYEWVPHPGRRLHALEELVSTPPSDGRELRFVGECAWPTGPGALMDEWNRFDAVLNHTLAGRAVDMLCAFNATRLPDTVLALAMASHPWLGGAADPPANAGFVPADRMLGDYDPEDLAVPAGAATAVVTTPGEARELMSRWLGELGTPTGRIDDTVLVMSELVTNSAKEQARTITVSHWATAHGFAVQVDDDGLGMADPLAGYRRAAGHAVSGRGLWIARQLADAFVVASRPGWTRVRFEMADVGASGHA
ncbi:MAG TPA: anti-sigma factor RsbA family regulatory protein [Acidimicrobiales bacterium]|nr:anti-sigma factor RsbA family regulatory protein [Acidimicrobiales bacterium]